MTEGRRRRVRKEEQVWVWSQRWRRAGVVEDTRLDTAGPGEESRLAWVLQGPCHGGPLAGRSVTCSGLSTVPLAATEPCRRGFGGGRGAAVAMIQVLEGEASPQVAVMETGENCSEQRQGRWRCWALR